MQKKSNKYFPGLSIIISLILTVLLANSLGKTIQYYETSAYKYLAGKKSQEIRYDSLGVPVVFYEGRVGTQYNVVSITEEALRWSAKTDSLSNSRFFASVNWLMQNAILLNDSSLIYYNHYDWWHYGMKAPWRSAMNQGRVMQSFLKAFGKTGDSIYLEYARKSMNTLLTKVGDGGVSYKGNTGYWYEEYADDSVKESRVLNGMIVVLQGLNDYHKQAGDTLSLFLFNEGALAVKNNLTLYDHNGHSNYDALGKPASAWYHKFHVRLLNFLHKETGEPVFKEYADKWSDYKEPGFIRGLMAKPSKIGFLALFSLFAVFMSAFTLIFYLLRKE